MTGAEGKVRPMRALAVEAMTLKLPVFFEDQSDAVRMLRAVMYLKPALEHRIKIVDWD